MFKPDRRPPRPDSLSVALSVTNNRRITNYSITDNETLTSLSISTCYPSHKIDYASHNRSRRITRFFYMLCIDHYNVLKFTFISVSTHRRCLCKLTCTVARVAGSTVTLSGSGTAQNVGENISGKPEVQPDLLQMLAPLHLLLNHQPGNVFLTIFLLNILKCLNSLCCQNIKEFIHF